MQNVLLVYFESILRLEFSRLSCDGGHCRNRKNRVCCSLNMCMCLKTKINRTFLKPCLFRLRCLWRSGRTFFYLRTTLNQYTVVQEWGSAAQHKNYFSKSVVRQNITSLLLLKTEKTQDKTKEKRGSFFLKESDTIWKRTGNFQSCETFQMEAWQWMGKNPSPTFYLNSSKNWVLSLTIQMTIKAS